MKHAIGLSSAAAAGLKRKDHCHDQSYVEGQVSQLERRTVSPSPVGWAFIGGPANRETEPIQDDVVSEGGAGVKSHNDTSGPAVLILGYTVSLPTTLVQ